MDLSFNRAATANARRSRGWRIGGLCLLPLAAAAQQGEPLRPTVTEQVEVRLVLVDTLVLDRAGRTVADLNRDDFELFVDYAPRVIDTLDHACPSGAAEDPRAVSRLGDARPTPAPDDARQLVLALDYMHLGQTERVEVIESLRDTIAGSDPAAEQVMIAAITGDLRIEQVFTGDRQRTLDTLERMEHDISLWLPAFDHLHELRFFRSLDRLVDLLGLVPGSKAVVLYSNIPGPSASYDLAFERLASKATHARVVFYPVLARGLSPTSSPRLARLAVETGGRFTENTNDLSLGYARAQRDLTCRYILGFYDENPERGRARRISVRVRRPGARAVHSNSYEFPTPDEETDSRLQAALIAPGMFAGHVRTGFYPLRPSGPRRWEGLVAVEFPVDPAAWSLGAAVRDVAASLRDGQRIAHAQQHRLTLRAGTATGGPSRMTYLSHAVAKPGDYELTAAVSDPRTATPAAATVEVSLPPVPEDGVFLVPPILGRSPATGIEIVVAGGEGRSADFEPLLLPRIERGTPPLRVLTHVCRSGKLDPGAEATLEHTLRGADGRSLLALPQTAPRWPDDGRVACLPFANEFSVSDLADGDYVIDVTLRLGDRRDDRRLSFAVGPPPPPP